MGEKFLHEVEWDGREISSRGGVDGREISSRGGVDRREISSRGGVDGRETSSRGGVEGAGHVFRWIVLLTHSWCKDG